MHKPGRIRAPSKCKCWGIEAWRWHVACTLWSRRFAMQTFRKILFPVDMSDSCTAAAPFVATMAKKFQAEVTLLHVLQMPPGYVTDWYGYMALVDTNAIREARHNEFDTYLSNEF